MIGHTIRYTHVHIDTRSVNLSVYECMYACMCSWCMHYIYHMFYLYIYIKIRSQDALDIHDDSIWDVNPAASEKAAAEGDSDKDSDADEGETAEQKVSGI